MAELRLDFRADHQQMVLDILQKNIPEREVWVFGSRARGAAKPYSDLDLAVIGEQPLSLSVLATLTDDFAESDLPFRVDLVDWATTSERFRLIIERDRFVIQSAAA